MSELEKKYDKEIIKILEGFGYLGDTDYGTEYFSCIGNQETNTPFEILNLLNKFKQLQQENVKLKQWDVNKDTRNSRQRVENAKLIKENTQLKQQLKDKDKEIEFVRKSCNESLRLSREKQKKLNSIKDILESNKED